MKDLKSLYNISLYILNHNPYGKNEPMELKLFSRLLFESEASQLFSTGLVRIKDYWEIDKKKDIILPISFKEILSSEKYRIWLIGDKICTDEEADLNYLSQYTIETLDNQLRIPTSSNWTIETWYSLRMRPCYSGFAILLKNEKIDPMMIIDYVFSSLRNYIKENFEIDKALGNYSE